MRRWRVRWRVMGRVTQRTWDVYAVLGLGLLLLAACDDNSYYGSNKAAKPVEPFPDDATADWRTYGQMPDANGKLGFTTEVSIHSISQQDPYGEPGYVYVWVRRTFAAPQTYIPVSPRSDPGYTKPDTRCTTAACQPQTYQREYTKFALDCDPARRLLQALHKENPQAKLSDLRSPAPPPRMAGIATELRDAQANKVVRYDLAGYQWEWETIKPDTYQSDFMRQVCTMAKIPLSSPPDTSSATTTAAAARSS